MEPLFKSTRVMTEKLAREIFRNTNYIYHLFNISMLIIAVYYNIYYACYYYGINIMLFAMIPLAIASYISRPYTIGRHRVKEYTALHNETETDEYLFFDDFFITRDIYSKSELTISYTSVTNVRASKNFYYFSIKNSKSKIVVPKKTDDETKTEEFIHFINSKITNSKNKIR